MILEEVKLTISRGDGTYTFQGKENGLSILDVHDWKQETDMVMLKKSGQRIRAILVQVTGKCLPVQAGIWNDGVSITEALQKSSA